MYRKISPVVAGILFIALWELLVRILNTPLGIVPPPSHVFQTFLNKGLTILHHVSITMIESLAGFFLGSLIGILIAIVFLYSSLLKDATYPYMVAIKATPVIAIAPLIVIWFGNGLFSKIVMAALIVFFPVLVNAYKGLSSASTSHLELFSSLSSSTWQTFWKLRVPSALPFLFSAFKIGSTFAVVGATIGEFTGASAGAGHLIIKASYYLDTGLMFATILLLSLAGILFFKMIDYMEKRVIFWTQSA